jgi:hypothetical protein
MLPTAPGACLEPELALDTNCVAFCRSRFRKLPAGPGERVAASLDDHPPAIPTLLDHVLIP